MKQCLDLTKQVFDSQGEAYINIRMGDSFQFTFNNQDNPVKRKSLSQKVRDNFRHQEFKEKKLKEETDDVEKVDDTDVSEIKVEENESKEDFDEIVNVWKVKGFFDTKDLDILEKHILEEKDSNVFQQNYWVKGRRETYQAIRDLTNVRKVRDKDGHFMQMNFVIGDQYSIGFIENTNNWPKYVKKIEREISETKKHSQIK